MVCKTQVKSVQGNIQTHPTYTQIPTSGPATTLPSPPTHPEHQPHCLQYDPYKFQHKASNVPSPEHRQPARLDLHQGNQQQPIPHIFRPHHHANIKTPPAIQSHSKGAHGVCTAGCALDDKPVPKDKGCTNQGRQYDPPPGAGGVRRARKRMFCFDTLADANKGIMYMEQPGRFPVMSFVGMQYIYCILMSKMKT